MAPSACASSSVPLDWRISAAVSRSNAITNQTLLATETELNSRLDATFNMVLPRANKERAKVVALVPMDLMIAISSMWMSRCDDTRYRKTSRLHDGVGRHWNRDAFSSRDRVARSSRLTGKRRKRAALRALGTSARLQMNLQSS